MTWVIFALGAGLCWGFYGVASHTSQVKFGNNPMKVLLCVGLAYFLIGVILPLIALGSKGQINNFNQDGVVWGALCGTLGALGAVCIIYAFKNGGTATYVMPLVFGGAPIVNVIITMLLHPPKNTPNPLLWVGMLLVSAGAGMVLYFKPA